MQEVRDKKILKATLMLHQKKIKECGALRLGIFGSYVKGTQKKGSDIDLLVAFDKKKKNYGNFIKLAYFLEDLLGKEVELVTEESLSPYIKPHITKEVEYVIS